MKIGLLKFCITLDFDPLGATSNSGCDDRYGFIGELVKRGHEITIFTPLVRGYKNDPKEERWLLKSDTEDIPGHMKWVKKLGYAPGELPVGDFKVDVLIADAGVGNIQYPDKYVSPGPECSLIRRFMRIIAAHKGPVFYLHNDPTLPFYFRQLAGREYQWGTEKNGYTNPIEENRNYSGWVAKSGWGKFEEIFSSDRKNIVLSRALPETFDYMLDTYDVDRVGYKEFSKHLHFEYQPPAYSYELLEDYEFQTHIEYPLFYSGGDRQRRIAFRRYYEEMGISTYVSGKWAEEAMATFDGINFLGWIETRKDLLDLMNKSGALVQIQPKSASKMGWWTARSMEAAACKTMCFMDGNIRGADRMVFDDYFVVNNKEEATDKISAFLKLPNKDRKRIIETQLAYCKTLFTWEKFTDVFLAYCKKYMEKKNVVLSNRNGYDDVLSEFLLQDSSEEYSEEMLSPGYIEEEEEIEESVIEEQVVEDRVESNEIPNPLDFVDTPKETNTMILFKDIPE